jgi:hypothetical protein
VLEDGDEVFFGCTAIQMQRNMAAVHDMASNSSTLLIVVKALGFGEDDPAGSILDLMKRLDMNKNVTVLTGSGMVTVKGDANNIPTHTGNNANGSSIMEIYDMEARLNAKECNRIYTVKCDGKSVAMEWYESIGVHGSMWGVFNRPPCIVDQG